MNRLSEKYTKEIKQSLKKDLNLGNIYEVPKLEKISLNAGIGSFRDNKEAVECFSQELSDIAGQKAFPRKARLSEAGFKIRQGDTVGYSVTLRGERMWAFLDKLISIALPRVRDFRGVNPNSFDKNGNYSLGITEHAIFPEVNLNKTKGIRHMQLTVVFSKNNVEHNRALLESLGMPFRK